MFGGITALFSGLAFAGLVTTMVMQRQELELQRKELAQTREVFSMQQFENTFFGLITIFNDHVNSIEIVKSDLKLTARMSNEIKYKGRSALVLIADNLPKGTDKESTRAEIQSAINEYELMYNRDLESELGPYFRLLYNIIRHIEHADFRGTEKEKTDKQLIYSKIVRAHLNSSEVKLLMFNCASVHGSGLKSWVVKHSLLKHITRVEYWSHKGLVDLYDKLAFRFDERRD